MEKIQTLLKGLFWSAWSLFCGSVIVSTFTLPNVTTEGKFIVIFLMTALLSGTWWLGINEHLESDDEDDENTN